jgi:hypothetical protein
MNRDKPADPRERGCLSKVAHDTLEAAEARGQKGYHCKYCKKFHATGEIKIATLANCVLSKKHAKQLTNSQHAARRIKQREEKRAKLRAELKRKQIRDDNVRAAMLEIERRKREEAAQQRTFKARLLRVLAQFKNLLCKQTIETTT